MHNEMVKNFYEEIKFITIKIGEKGLAQKLIEAAKDKHKPKMKKIARQFKRDNLELWGRMSLFYEEYSEENPSPYIFTSSGYEYNPSEINPVNFVIMLILSGGLLDETKMFQNWRNLQYALEDVGYNEIAEYMEEHYMNNLEFLIEAYR